MLEVRERLKDLNDALRQAGRLDLVRELKAYPATLISASRVRNGVEGLRQQCELWRSRAGQLPDLPVVMLAANRLEDACREVIASGLFPALPPTAGQQLRRISIVVTIGVVAFGLVALVPILLTARGVDITDIDAERTMPPIALPRGGETRLEVGVLAEALAPEATQGVTFAPKDRCERPTGGACEQTEPRLWEAGRLPTYELKLPQQAYGVLFAFTGERLIGKVGSTTLLLAATEDTPEGHYELPLTASYLGYTPLPCGAFARVIGNCPAPRTEEGARHVGLGVPLVVIDVVPGDPGGPGRPSREALAMQAAREKAAERAKQIAAAMETVGAAMGEIDAAMRRSRWELAREKLAKLAELFGPLDADAAGGEASEEVELARDRFAALRDRLTEFETELFEDTYRTLKAPESKTVPEDRLMTAIAQRHRVGRAYVEEIYTQRADEIQARLAAEKQEEEERLKREEEELTRRCGKAPQNTWAAVKEYASELHPGEEVEMRECLSPRLDPLQCWIVLCRYTTRGEVSDERPKALMKYRGAFYIKDNYVTHHGPP